MSPRVSAAALANVTHPPVRNFSASRSGSDVSHQTPSAYVGLPGPAKTYDAARTLASAVSRVNVSTSDERNEATSIGRPTLCWKYSTARDDTMSAFSWQP